MGREQTLTDRVGQGGMPKGGYTTATVTEDVDALAESVRDNLGRLLNARHGMSEALPDYGLPSLIDLATNSKDYVRILQEAIRNSIEKYEPRLQKVRVSRDTDAGDKTTMRFRVDALLVGRHGKHKVWYSTAMRSNGLFDVEG